MNKFHPNKFILYQHSNHNYSTKTKMNIIIVLFFILINMLSYIDNMENPMIKSSFSLHKYKRNLIQILMNNRHKERFSRCISPCQLDDCCEKSNCLCIRDYWGPVCYCRK
jgi:hypothetical protein